MKTRHLVAMAMMTTLLIILGLLPPIPLGVIPVPIVLQNLGIMLVSLLLGGKKGSISVSLLLVLGLVLPVFSGGHLTLTVLAGQTAGYVLAWLMVPACLSALSRVLPSSSLAVTMLKIWLAGVLMVDVLGGAYFAWFTGQSLLQGIIVSNLAFLPLDTIKALVAAYLAHYLKRFNF